MRRHLIAFYKVAKYRDNAPLRWLKTVSNTFQDLDFDGSLLPLLIS